MGWKKSAKDGDLVASSIVSFQILPWICCKMNSFSLFYGKKTISSGIWCIFVIPF